jgi:hypothetical protein
MELTRSQKESRENLLDWFSKTRSSIIEHIDRDTDDYGQYLIIKEGKTPDEFCSSLIRVLGDNVLENVLYYLMEDYYTFKQYELYFNLNEEYEISLKVRHLEVSLFNHIQHLIECSHPKDSEVREGLIILVKALLSKLDNSFIEQYGL